MANYTTNLNLEKPLQEEFYNVDVFNANADKIDAAFPLKANLTHKHDGTQGNSAKITSTEIADGAVTDSAIGNRTIDDSTALAGTAAPITTLFGQIANMIRNITGKPTWYTPPSVTLEALNTLIVSVAAANKLLKLDVNSKLPASITGSADGNSATATTLQTARTIAISGKVTGTATSFNGGANISIPVTAVTADSCTGNSATATTAESCTGNSATATKLTTARTIAGVSFDGTANIAIPYANLTGLPTIPNALAYDAAHSFANNGYQILSNGLIFQWGVTTNTSDASPTITFPIAFTTMVFGIWATYNVDATGNSYSNAAKVRSYGLTSFYINVNTKAFWFAIGY